MKDSFTFLSEKECVYHDWGCNIPEVTVLVL